LERSSRQSNWNFHACLTSTMSMAKQRLNSKPVPGQSLLQHKSPPPKVTGSHS
jgi:hypothetical protein